MHRQGFLTLPPSRKVHTWMIALTMLLAPVVLSACDVAGVSSPTPAVIEIKTFYFQSISAVGQACKNVPDNTQDWFVLVEVDGIDNSAPGAVNFTFDMKNLVLAPNATTSSKDYAEQAFLDNYWQPTSQQNGPITVPAGQKFDNTQIHQAQLFLMNLGPQPNLANTATPGGEVPAVLYTGALFSPEGSRTVWAGANATSSTRNQSIYTTTPVTQMGPC